MTAQSQVENDMQRFRSALSENRRNRDFVQGHPLGTELPDQYGARVRHQPTADLERIAQASESWSPERAPYPTDYRMVGVFQLLGAAILVGIGVKLALWLIGMWV